MSMALLSAITGIPAANNVAMTGEITLRGNVLPIGGLTEKLLAAKRNGIKTVLIPKDNEIDLKEIQDKVTNGMKIISIDKIEDAIPYIFPKSQMVKSKSGKVSVKPVKKRSK